MEIEFYSHRYSLYHLEHYFCYLMENIHLPVELRDKIRLCFYEAVTNAVIHGNEYDESKKVWIHAAADLDSFRLTIQDEGRGFCLNSLENPCAEENLLKSSGRGILFVREHSDLIHYDQENHRLQIAWNL